MKNNIILQYLFLLGFCTSILAISSCKKDETPCCDKNNPECPNYDPCYESKPVTAGFDILESMGSSAQYIDSFTLVNNISGLGLIKFVAKEKNAAKYTWYIGSEIIEDVSEISRAFYSPDVQIGTVVDVMLIVEKEADTLCFPFDDGIDTLMRTFTIVNPCEYGVTGEFRGKWAGNNSDSFDIKLQFVGRPGFDCGLLHVSNLDESPSCDSIYSSVSAINSSFIIFETGSACTNPYPGGVTVDMRYDAFSQQVTLHHTITYIDLPTSKTVNINRIFKGRKLN